MFQGDGNISPSSNHSEATGRGGSVPVRGVCEVKVYPTASRERKNNNFPLPFFVVVIALVGDCENQPLASILP